MYHDSLNDEAQWENEGGAPKPAPDDEADDESELGGEGCTTGL